MKAVILLAKKSKQLFPFSETIPKPLIYIAGKTILENLIGQLKSVGITELILVVNHHKEKIFELVGNGSKLGVTIQYVAQPSISGVGNALLCVKDHIPSAEPFMVLSGDIQSLAVQFSKLIQTHRVYPKHSISALSHPTVGGFYSPVYIDATMNVDKLEEDTESTNISNYVLTGAFIFHSTIFDTLKKNNEDIFISLQDIIAQKQLKACVWEEYWIDFFYPWDILQANRILMDTWHQSKIDATADIEQGAIIKGPVLIGEHVKICAGSVVHGPACIGNNAFIGNNVLIRPYSNIGPETIIGFGTEIKNATVFGHSKVGRLSFIGDSVIGSKVNIGACTMTANCLTNGNSIRLGHPFTDISADFQKLGAFIGDHVLIGSNHLLQPGLFIPPHTGIPDNITVTQSTVDSFA